MTFYVLRCTNIAAHSNAPPPDGGQENRQNAKAASQKDTGKKDSSQLSLLRKRHASKSGHSGVGAANSPTSSDSTTDQSDAPTGGGEDSIQGTAAVLSSSSFPATSRNQDEKEIERVAPAAVEDTGVEPRVCRGGDENHVGPNGGEGAIAMTTATTATATTTTTTTTAGDLGVEVEDNGRTLFAPPSTSPPVMMPTLATSPSQSDWKRAVTESGRAYEYHKESRTTRWVHHEAPRTTTTSNNNNTRTPQTDIKVHRQRRALRQHSDGTLATPLNQPLGNWRQAFTSEGNVYYYNRETRVSTWICPDATLDIDRGGGGDAARHLLPTPAAAGQSGDAETVRQLFANSPSVGTTTTTTTTRTPAKVEVETTCFCPFCGDRCGSAQLGQHLLQACTSRQHLERDQPMAFWTVRSQLLQAVVHWEAVDAARRQEQEPRESSRQHALAADGDGDDDDDDDVLRSTDTMETTDFSRPELKETCELCGREFAKGRLACHAKVCERVFMHKRPAFNAQQKRLDGTPQKRMLLYGEGTVFCALCGNGFDNEGLKRHMKVTRA
jgi:hypothetical protein